jgi:alginate O-acetyltransferase complex protein AlgI
MLFNTFEFAVFFPVVTLLYFAAPAGRRWIVLLIASAVFYMAFIPAYLLILLALIVVDYTAALLIERAKGPARRRLLLVSVASNIGMLGAFKYYNFVAMNVDGLARVMGYSPSSLPLLSWVLPIGLSFHTFQSMAYTIEVYRGRFPAEHHLGYYALYVMYYPQLVAGPIERPYNLLPQLRREQVAEPTRIASGLKLMAWGLFKKVVIADRLAFVVNAVYAQPSSANGAALTVATVFFAWQIYCDFSGYTDIAIGAAEVMGIDLMRNFRRPYLATSTRDFWARWHVSLSSWFRDYVYIPFGGSRFSRARWAIALMTTFLISGLWHGANWTFVVWGALNGAFLLIGAITAGARARIRDACGFDEVQRLRSVVQAVITFSLISITWIFFRAKSVDQGWYILTHLLSRRGESIAALGVSSPQLVISCILIAGLLTIEAFQTTDDPREYVIGQPAWVRWAVYYSVVVLTLTIGVFNRSEFIYFQF